MSFGNISVIWIYERPKQGIASEPKKMFPIMIQCPLKCLRTRSILNHDFLNEHTQPESEGIKPIDKTARHKQSQSSREVVTQTWQQRIIGIWYKKDASLGMEWRD